MSDAFIGEIKLFAGDFAPMDWALCSGQKLRIASHKKLFSLIGTTYGGDGHRSFLLPDFRGRMPMQQGTGPGLDPRRLGQKEGREEITLTRTTSPSHTHVVTIGVANGTADSMDADNNSIANTAEDNVFTKTPDPNELTYRALAGVGFSSAVHEGGKPHNNMQPCLGINFIIALRGDYPS